MREVLYRQCGLRQGNSNVVGWIEDRGARIGAFVEIDELGGRWEVVGVGTSTRSKAEVHKAESLARQPFTAMKSYRKVEG